MTYHATNHDGLDALFSSPLEPLQEAILRLQDALDDDVLEFQICREFVCMTFYMPLVRNLTTHLRVKMWFVGEEENDTGGLTREMW